jgi:hypothetical protein
LWKHSAAWGYYDGQQAEEPVNIRVEPTARLAESRRALPLSAIVGQPIVG